MPRDGIDFLEAAMDLVPRARRALFTAYADTDAAIAAINVVDVDHYLLKPWEPPEEKLYPVVDELIAAWQDTAQQSDKKIKILGHPWSAASYEVRDDFLRATWCPTGGTTSPTQTDGAPGRCRRRRGSSPDCDHRRRPRARATQPLGPGCRRRSQHQLAIDFYDVVIVGADRRVWAPRSMPRRRD